MEDRGIREWLANTEGKRREGFGVFAFYLRQGSMYFLGFCDLKIPVWEENCLRKFLWASYARIQTRALDPSYSTHILCEIKTFLSSSDYLGVNELVVLLCLRTSEYAFL